MDPVNLQAKFEVRSFTRSWDNSGYLKTLGSPWIRPRCLFSVIFNWVSVRMDHMNVLAKFEVRSFTRSWDNSEYLKNFVQSLDTLFKVVQGRCILVPIESAYDFLLVRNSNLGPILHRFGDIAGFLRSRVTPPLFRPNFRGVPVALVGPCWGQPEQRP